ncbi:glycoside hydrolase family 104 protein [Pseudomonas silvicola]|nr:glycoside hydrolase family 104 protein [Pseudomonas silvicola]
MPCITAQAAGGPNVGAFLDMLAWSEGTSISRYTKNNGYDVIVGGLNSPNTFTAYAAHPNVLVTVNNAGLKSTAAGRYQLLYRYWVAYSALLKLPDFSPLSQDRIAIQQIVERKALADIKEGNIAQAISKCSNIWASLPGNTYGQHMHSTDSLIAQYIATGGVLA